MMSPGTSTISPVDFDQRRARYRTLIPPARLLHDRFTIVGVGSVGREVGRQLVTMGAQCLTLIDPDTVEDVNTGSQSWFPEDVGHPKVERAAAFYSAINPDVIIRERPVRFTRDLILASSSPAEVRFVCVDTMSARASILESAMLGFMADARIGGQSGHIYSWSSTQAPRSNEWINTAFPADQYERILVPDAEQYGTGCVVQSTYPVACFAASLMIYQWMKWASSGEAARRQIDFDLLLPYVLVRPQWIPIERETDGAYEQVEVTTRQLSPEMAAANDEAIALVTGEPRVATARSPSHYSNRDFLEPDDRDHYDAADEEEEEDEEYDEQDESF